MFYSGFKDQTKLRPHRECKKNCGLTENGKNLMSKKYNFGSVICDKILKDFKKN